LAPQSVAVLSGRGVVRLELRMAELAKQDFEAALAVDEKSEFARWGRDSAAEQMKTAGLQIILAGFKVKELNGKYVERRRPGFTVNGLASYWSLDGMYFLYYCEKEQRWKGSRWDNFSKVQGGGQSGFIAAPVGADIRSLVKLRKGWAEWDSKVWVLRKPAGVMSVKPLDANVQTLTLQGFERADLNGRYAERFRPRFIVNGRETYWSGDGERFLYWSSKECRWKGSLATDLPRVSSGKNTGFIGAPKGADILSPNLAIGWHEWTGQEWRLSEKAGVATVITLASSVKPQQHQQQGKPQPEEAPPAKKQKTADAGEEAKQAPAPAAAAAASDGLPGPHFKLRPKALPKVPAFQAQLKNLRHAVGAT